MFPCILVKRAIIVSGKQNPQTKETEDKVKGAFYVPFTLRKVHQDAEGM